MSNIFLIIQDTSILLDGLVFGQSDFSTYLGKFLCNVITAHSMANTKNKQWHVIYSEWLK